MAKYISVDDLRAATTKCNKIWNTITDASGRGLDEIIDSLPSTDVQPVQRWNPCNKGLPKKDGDYYVTTHNGQIARYIFIKGVSEEYWMRCATAWMPLPEPYKGGEQNVEIH